MKRLALAVAVLSVAACTTKDTQTDATTDSAAMMAPTPAMSDTGMMMRDSMMRDSMMRDSMSMKGGMSKKP